MGLFEGITAIAAAGMLAMSTPAPTEMPSEKIIFDMANAQGITTNNYKQLLNTTEYYWISRKRPLHDGAVFCLVYLYR